MVLDNMDWLDNDQDWEDGEFDEFDDWDCCEADLAAEHDWENWNPVEEELREIEEFAKGIDTWETKDKEVIPISKMSTSHIKNCIKKIIGDEWRELCLWSLTKELIRRNEL